jgi:protein-tyrosine phosphatase
MLNVTALALGDRATAQLSARHLEDYAGAVQKINHVISDVVIEELRKDDHTIVNANAAQDNRKVVDRAWQESKDDSTSTMSGSAL